MVFSTFVSFQAVTPSFSFNDFVDDDLQCCNGWTRYSQQDRLTSTIHSAATIKNSVCHWRTIMSFCDLADFPFLTKRHVRDRRSRQTNGQTRQAVRLETIRRFARWQYDVVCWRSQPTPGFPVQKTATCLCLLTVWQVLVLASFMISSDFMMELYPKTVDFNESWDTLRESTRLMISGEGYLSKEEWNDRIMYP